MIIPESLLSIMQVMGFAVLFWSILKLLLSLRRGYGYSFTEAGGGIAAGTMLASVPLFLPALLGLTTTALDPAETKSSAPAEKPSPDFDPLPASADVGGLVVIGVVMALVLLGLACWGVWSLAQHRRSVRKSDREAAAAAAAEELVRLDRVWQEAVERHDHLREESMRHQSDIDLVLSVPLINDMSEPKTAAFIEALAKATDLAHDTRPSGAEAVESYAAATRAAERAWGIALRHADRVRLSGFDPAERSTIHRVAKLMKQAERGSTTEERRAFYNRAMDLLDDLITVPAPAAEAIESRVRGVLANPNPNTVSYHLVENNVDRSILRHLARKTFAFKETR